MRALTIQVEVNGAQEHSVENIVPPETDNLMNIHLHFVFRTKSFLILRIHVRVLSGVFHTSYLSCLKWG